MRQEIIDFINTNEDLIENNEWEEVYKRAKIEFSASSIGHFTKMLLDADIHPEKYLSELPIDFLYRTDIKSFVVPNNITSISLWAFRECSRLTNITISDSVKSIESEAFHYCRGLTSVALGNGVESIGSRAFSSCEGLTNITIPNSVTSIDFEAFSNCGGLRNIEIPDSVINMGTAVFWDCGENLVINYKGTKAQFRALTKGCFPNTYFICHCTDGDVVKRKR